VNEPEKLQLPRGETMPNSRLPVLIYRETEGGFEELFAQNGWRGIWRNGIYDFDHYHSNAHEVLGIERGSAKVQLGGDEGVEVEVKAGDVMVLPAGTGHRRLSQTADLLVVGAYPPGGDAPDLCRERTPELELRISKVGVPDIDPVHGEAGPLRQTWLAAY
jgi:uncharacterized protein YjlB